MQLMRELSTYSPQLMQLPFLAKHFLIAGDKVSIIIGGAMAIILSSNAFDSAIPFAEAYVHNDILNCLYI